MHVTAPSRQVQRRSAAFLHEFEHHGGSQPAAAPGWWISAHPISVATGPSYLAARHAAAQLICSRQQSLRLKQGVQHAFVRTTSAPRYSLSARCEASSGAPLPPWKQKNARLVLEDGSVWHGVSFGATGQAVGEVVFNTSMSGYQVRVA